MKKTAAVLLCLLLPLSWTGCGAQEEVGLRAEEVRDMITSYFSTDGIHGNNYVDCSVDPGRDVVIVQLNDVSEEMREELIHKVFSGRTGSICINCLKDHEMLAFISE